MLQITLLGLLNLFGGLKLNEIMYVKHLVPGALYWPNICWLFYHYCYCCFVIIIMNIIILKGRAVISKEKYNGLDNLQ